MRIRAGLTTLLLAGGALAATAAPSPASATPTVASAGSPGGQAFTVTAGTLTAHDGPTKAHVATIDYDIYRPASATASTPQPAVLMTHGFGLTKASNEMVSNARFFASHGYVVLAWTAEGFGKSSGCVTLDSFDYDVRDAQQLMDVLQSKDYVKKDAKGAVVGMIGGSYGGGIDPNVAEADARVRAIIPARTWGSLQFALDPNNIVVPGDPTGFSHQLVDQGVFKFEWTSLFFALGNSGPATGAGGCAQDKLASGDPATVAGVACPGFYAAVCQTYVSLAATGNAGGADRTLVRASSSATHLDRLRVPTLLTQGQSDTLFNEDEALSTYAALQQAGVPTAMAWNSGGHGGYQSQPGEGEVYDGRLRSVAEMDASYLPQRELAWFDHYLKHLSVATGPGFSWFRDYVTNPGLSDASAAWGSSPAYPAMSSTTYGLSGHALVAAGGAVTSATQTFVDTGVPTSYSETSNFQAPGSTTPVGGLPFSTNPVSPTDAPGTALTFDTPAFTVDTESVGAPSAHLHLTHTSPVADLVFFGKVEDVAPDGSITLIHRLIAPVRVVPALAGKPVDLHLAGFAHLFRTGHRARLVLAATDATSPQAAHTDTITLATGGTDPSTFSLPQRPFVVPAVTKPVTHPVKKPAAPTTPTLQAPPGGALAATGLAALLPVLALALLGAGLGLRRGRR